MFLLLAAALAPAAPVPKPRLPNPVGFAYVGVRVSTEEGAAGFGIDTPEPDTPALRAGLRKGDRVVGVGGKTVTNFEEFADYVIDLRPGTRVVVVVRRNGELKRVWVTLGERPADYGDPDFSRKEKK